jgi:hypothetical protein
MSQSAHESLVSYWTRGGLKISQGCPEVAVRKFGIGNNVVLPADLRAYFLNVNGMLPEAREDCDLNGFCLWPLDRVKSVTDEIARHSSPIRKSPEDHLSFIFTDYREWSWAYAIRLTNRANAPNPVVHVGTLKPKIVADSFSQFVQLYVRDAAELYPV